MKHSRDYKADKKIKAKSVPINRSQDTVFHLHEYGLDLNVNHIYLVSSNDYINGGLGEEEPGVEYSMANRFIKNLNLCMRVNPDKPIVIHMKTPGGFVEDGMAIYDSIKFCH